MSRAPWVAHFGLVRTPFSKRIAADDLFTRAAHAEAVARIGFCVTESALGVIVGDVSAGKTVAVRAAVAGLDPTRHTVIYIANPSFGTRGLYVSTVLDRPLRESVGLPCWLPSPSLGLTSAGSNLEATRQRATADP
jgi:type II secretory pathway predicted ATPase ExeA